ncbi:hypothetical protein IscW_ISCW015860 [Ixodes scapularis]|uniref:Uncharacterized protein n=1 Tax=Ixodes scapularis TaxID=6945 RepID=B7P5C2_IXOSC|nr:hypothetical protein IscW_ISCW015860 [Ixodes scapularis]|eukprot:XP_002407234.1 hypothetical protein IscW_ISCW015860 [Ixodes scapularis]
MRGAIKRLRCSVRLGYCATEAHSWARGGASASAAAMTSLLWNAQTGEVGVTAAALARQLCAMRRHCSSRMRSTAHYASHAKLLNLGQCSSRYKRKRFAPTCVPLSACGHTHILQIDVCQQCCLSRGIPMSYAVFSLARLLIYMPNR